MLTKDEARRIAVKTWRDYRRQSAHVRIHGREGTRDCRLTRRRSVRSKSGRSETGVATVSTAKHELQAQLERIAAIEAIAIEVKAIGYDDDK